MLIGFYYSTVKFTKNVKFVQKKEVVSFKMVFDGEKVFFKKRKLSMGMNGQDKKHFNKDDAS